MTNETRKRPECSRCGECCRAPVVLITKPSDFRRWIEQGRNDILKYASRPPLRGYGDFWMDIRKTDDAAYCPFIGKTGDGEFTCTIHDTKPKVCREFRCEKCYGIGRKGVPFKTDCGWTDRAIRMGYGNPAKKKRETD